MQTETALDRAHAAMEAGGDAERLQFYATLADAELVVLLETEPEGETLSPEVFELSDMTCILAFDTEERLSRFTGRPVPYAALSGRVIAGLLQDQGIALALNLEVAPSQTILPPEALGWLTETLTHAPDEAQARPVAFDRPQGLPEALLGALDARLGAMPGLARSAFLARVTYDDDSRGHLLAFSGAAPRAHAPLAKAVGEALTFSGLDAGALDVTFLGDGDTALEALARVAWRFDIPEPVQPKVAEVKAPGMDPDAPPKLR
ncbi:SseB family protein [Mesobacterium pallidum]|uniref:SseB family protein n=1 Tax=Mesobacterium pallidum TaxID=2872037 RepID=UPI001EE1E692|nr:SseB family protein [Mesobacterium pallidum]